MKKRERPDDVPFSILVDPRQHVVRGVPIVCKQVVASSWFRHKLEKRGDAGIRAFVTAQQLHKIGDPDVLVYFVELAGAEPGIPPVNDNGTGMPTFSIRAEAQDGPPIDYHLTVWARVHECDPGSPSYRWTPDERDATLWDAVRASLGVPTMMQSHMRQP